MKWPRIYVAWVLVVFTGICWSSCTFADGLRAWGADSAGQVSDLPVGTDYVVVAAGDAHGLALRSDGTVVAWGQNADGQCKVPSGTYKAIGAGAGFSLAIRPRGTISAWGDDDAGQVSAAPAGNDFVAVDGGLHFAVALRSDGTIVAWGDDRYGQVSGTPADNDFVAVVAGDAHAVALRSDGSLASWGYWAAVEGMPTTGTYAAVSAGGNQCLALTVDGAIVWWGDAPEEYVLEDVPAGNDYVGIAAGYLHGLAITNDGLAVGWGAGVKVGEHPDYGQADPPAGHDYTAVAGGLHFSVGLVAHPASLAVFDDFDDNRRGAMWLLEGDDLPSCWLEEANQRLELRATTAANWCSAFYRANGWVIDTSNDFSLRVDFYQEARLGDNSWLSVVLTPDVDSRGSQHVEFGVGSDDSYPYLWFEAIDQSIKHSRQANRNREGGTLYISYSTSADELYVSDRGYGAENAWATVKDLLRQAWAGQAVTLGLGGGSNRLAIDSGQAYLDNFLFETGDSVMTQRSAVYRFWSPVLGTHFYTINDVERDRLVKEFPDVWILEGAAFNVAAAPFDSDLAPVYRFWAPQTGAHLYTIDEGERDRLVKEQGHVWTFEAVAFYAYPEGQQPVETRPVYRFLNDVSGGYFYTISEKEKDRLLTDYRDVFTLESIAFYAYE